MKGGGSIGVAGTSRGLSWLQQLVSISSPYGCNFHLHFSIHLTAIPSIMLAVIPTSRVFSILFFTVILALFRRPCSSSPAGEYSNTSLHKIGDISDKLHRQVPSHHVQQKRLL